MLLGDMGTTSASTTSPVGALPATGSDGVGRVVMLAAAFAALGLLLWLPSRRRRLRPT